MTTVKARATVGPREPFKLVDIERRELQPNDITIDVQFAGICHSDIHTARNEWGEALFPLVPGHEIAGVVSSVGNAVTAFKVGDRAGVGCFVDTCRECDNCKAGDDHNCERGITGTYNAVDKYGKPTAGGYSEQIVIDENYALRIPEGIDMAQAAPLMCAGITLYSPLKRWGAGPGKKVAIVGMGGLGHMGVKIANAMGAEVTVLSQSLKKQEDGMRLGAEHYYATSDEGTFENLSRSFDLIISTVSANVDFTQYLGLVRAGGALVLVGLPDKEISVAPFALVGPEVSLAGSHIGSIKMTQEMLDFCGEHNLGAEVEVISGSQIDEAYDRVVGSDVRYRFVIDIAKLGD